MNAVIYARFSSHSQREQSIEGQLKTCYNYFDSQISDSAECSSMVADAPPNKTDHFDT